MTSFGSLNLPVQRPEPHLDTQDKHEALGDPTITRLVDYFKAFTNAEAGDGWRFASPNENPVHSAHTHDPNKYGFNTKFLPAYFLHRLGDPDYERLSEDSLLVHSNLRLLWVYGPAGQEGRRRLSSFVNAISKTLISAIEDGRHPAYVFPDDDDPTAATQGSVIYRVAGIFRIEWKGYKLTNVQIPMATGASRDRDGERGMYDAMEAQIELVEERRRDPNVFPLNRGANLTVTTPDKARDLAVAKL